MIHWKHRDILSFGKRAPETTDTCDDVKRNRKIKQNATTHSNLQAGVNNVVLGARHLQHIGVDFRSIFFVFRPEDHAVYDLRLCLHSTSRARFQQTQWLRVFIRILVRRSFFLFGSNLFFSSRNKDRMSVTLCILVPSSTTEHIFHHFHLWDTAVSELPDARDYPTCARALWHIDWKHILHTIPTSNDTHSPPYLWANPVFTCLETTQRKNNHERRADRCPHAEMLWILSQQIAKLCEENESRFQQGMQWRRNGIHCDPCQSRSAHEVMRSLVYIVNSMEFG